MLAIKGAPADHDTQVCPLSPVLNWILDSLFLVSNILWLYQTQGLIIIYTSVPFVTLYFFKKEDTSAGKKQRL